MNPRRFARRLLHDPETAAAVMALVDAEASFEKDSKHFPYIEAGGTPESQQAAERITDLAQLITADDSPEHDREPASGAAHAAHRPRSTSTWISPRHTHVPTVADPPRRAVIVDREQRDALVYASDVLEEHADDAQPQTMREVGEALLAMVVAWDAAPGASSLSATPGVQDGPAGASPTPDDRFALDVDRLREHLEAEYGEAEGLDPDPEQGGLPGAIARRVYDANDCDAITGPAGIEVQAYRLTDALLVCVREERGPLDSPMRQIASYAIEAKHLANLDDTGFTECCAALEAVLSYATELLPCLRALQAGERSAQRPSSVDVAATGLLVDTAFGIGNLSDAYCLRNTTLAGEDVIVFCEHTSDGLWPLAEIHPPRDGYVDREQT